MPKLINIQAKKSFEIKNAATDAEIILYASIGQSMWEDSISAKQFAEELKKLPKDIKNLKVRINSMGGDVFDGITIYNRLKQLNCKITVYVDGMAASIASVIAMAGDEIIMGEGATMMIHKPWTVVGGNSSDLQDTMDRLDGIEEQMLGIYARRTGLERNELRNMLANETWMSDQEAVDYGFANKVEGQTVKLAASLIDNATWIKKKPNMKAEADVRSKIEELKKNVEGFLAR